MDNKEQIKTFVRQAMGCGCPEEVFALIECRTDVRVEGVPLRARINVGNRLLIYVHELKSDGGNSLRDVLPRLVDAGRMERDALGFNRFRCVLAVDRPGEFVETAEDIFAKIDKDERMHLHVLSGSSLPLFGETRAIAQD